MGGLGRGAICLRDLGSPERVHTVVDRTLTSRLRKHQLKDFENVLCDDLIAGGAGVDTVGLHQVFGFGV